MHKSVAPLALVLMSLGATSLPLPAAAQEGPGTRVMTVTSFDVPYGAERGQVMRFLRERWLPEYQLNPKVVNLRVAQHNWGANADQIVVMAECAEFADIEAPCGAPCDENYDAHPLPEAGTPEREEYNEYGGGLEPYLLEPPGRDLLHLDDRREGRGREHGNGGFARGRGPVSTLSCAVSPGLGSRPTGSHAVCATGYSDSNLPWKKRSLSGS